MRLPENLLWGCTVSCAQYAEDLSLCSFLMSNDSVLSRPFDICFRDSSLTSIKKKKKSFRRRTTVTTTDRLTRVNPSVSHSLHCSPSDGGLERTHSGTEISISSSKNAWWSFTLRLRGSQQITQGKWWFLHRYRRPSDQRHKRQRADKSHWDSESGTGRLCGTTGGTLAVSCCF